MSNLIFDLDGTIADTFSLVLEFFRTTSYGSGLTDNDVKKIRSVEIKDALKVVSIPIWAIPRLLIKGRTEIAKNIDKVEIFSGMENVLRQLKSDGHELYVVSTNSQINVTKVLKNYDLLNLFKKVYGNSGILNKSSAIKQVIRKHKLDKQHTLYIGDEIRDVHAAHKAGIGIISVTWGFNSKQILLLQKPEFIVNKPEDIIKTVS